LQKSDLPPPQEDMQKWEAEFNQWMSSQREDGSDFTSAMNSHWNEIYGDTGSPSDAITYDDEGIPILGDYIFGKKC
jgi:peroxin-5